MAFLVAVFAALITGLLLWRSKRTPKSTERSGKPPDPNVERFDSGPPSDPSIPQPLQPILDGSPNGIITLTAIRDGRGGITDLAIGFANRRAQEMVGRRDLVGCRLDLDMHECWAAKHIADYAQVIASGTPFRQKVHSDGPDLTNWFLVHATPFGDGVMLTLNDITDQRKDAGEEAESDRIALTRQITRTVAHEVRNPLTNIRLATEQLHDEVADREDLVRPFFDIIGRNVDRIAGLVNGMLESSRMRTLHLTPCQLSTLVHQALEHVKDRMEMDRIEGVLLLADHLPEVMADPELLSLAISNITLNALEAMGTKGGVLRMELRATQDEVLLEISDTGKGIAREHLTRLFEPFYSVRPGGLGLGLTTTRSILHAHHIHLEVRSAEGEGTTFTLRFPRSIFATASSAEG